MTHQTKAMKLAMIAKLQKEIEEMENDSSHDMFWNYEYRHYLRDMPLEGRISVYNTMKDYGLEPDGKSKRHLQICKFYSKKYEEELEPEQEPEQDLELDHDSDSESEIEIDDEDLQDIVDAYQEVLNYVNTFKDRFKNPIREGTMKYYKLNTRSKQREWTKGSGSSDYFQNELCSILTSKALKTFTKLGFYKKIRRTHCLGLADCGGLGSQKRRNLYRSIKLRLVGDLTTFEWILYDQYMFVCNILNY